MNASVDNPQRRMLQFAMGAVLLTAVVVMLGAFTRLVDAGLGCPDWPGCYGHLTWPRSDTAVAAAEARFPDFPVEQDKTWPEMVHRYFASLLGLVIFGIAFWAFKLRRSNPDTPLKLPLVIAVLVVLQGAFGMWTVTLKLWPQVVTAHLLGGFATLSLLWLLVQRLGHWHWQVSAPEKAELSAFKGLALFSMFVVIAQIALGGWTSANYAALACTDLPTCHGQWWPEVDFVQGFNIFQAVGPNYLGGLLDSDARTAIHLTHRLGAILVTITLLTLAAKLWRSSVFAARRWGVVLCLVLALQVVLGVGNILWSLPLSVAVAHNAVGALLLLVLVAINHRLRTVILKG